MNDIGRQGPKRDLGLGRDMGGHQSVSLTASKSTSPQEVGCPNGLRPDEAAKRMLNTAKTPDHDWLFVPNPVVSAPLKDRTRSTAPPLYELSPFNYHLLKVIYHTGFDTIFSSRMSRYGCPFL